MSDLCRRRQLTVDDVTESDWRSCSDQLKSAMLVSDRLLRH